MWVDTEQVSDDEIYGELESTLTREHILRSAARNDEYPFGYVCDLILDNYPVTPRQNDRVTDRLLRHFGL